ncbi:rhodanese-like domain-containing protein [Patescibacteria group bacterium]|nr:rhodanese-like domain-containing protein [Patescibacteria group bacterium]
MKLAIVMIVVLVIGGALAFFIMRGNEDSTKSTSKNIKQTASYKNILPSELDSILDSSEDIFLVDVHIPEQTHIDGTDAFIPYNEIEGNVSNLPEDKDTPLVVYCRSGSMSRIASEKLLDLGYINVSNLEGGINAWNKYNN